VRYHYAPLSFTLGALLSATGLVIGAALLVGRPRRRLGAIPPPVE
jgi:hypothetical protein